MTLMALIAWLLRLPLAPRFLCVVHEVVRAVRHDLFHPRFGHEALTLWNCDGALRYAHHILHAAILIRACELAGLKPPRLRLYKPFRGRRWRRRTALLRRLGELLRRLDRFEAHARRLAQKLLDAHYGCDAAEAPQGVPASSRATPEPPRIRRAPSGGRARDGPATLLLAN